MLDPEAQIRELSAAGRGAATDRITIRLRPGDGVQVAGRAARRGMKPSTYVAALVRSHIVANPPMTEKEVAQLKEGLRILAAFGRKLADEQEPALSGPAQEALRKDLQTIRRLVEAVETCTHNLVRATRKMIVDASMAVAAHTWLIGRIALLATCATLHGPA